MEALGRAQSCSMAGGVVAAITCQPLCVAIAPFSRQKHRPTLVAIGSFSPVCLPCFRNLVLPRLPYMGFKMSSGFCLLEAAVVAAPKAGPL